MTPLDVEMMAMPRPLQDLGQLLSAGIDTQARLGNAAKAGDDLFLVAKILQGDVDDALVAVILDRGRP